MTTYIGSAVRLRFVVRKTQQPIEGAAPFTYERTDRILQYGLQPVNGGVEWFDVPCIDEPEDTQRSS